MQGTQEFMAELEQIVRENDESRKIDRIKKTAQRMAKEMNEVKSSVLDAVKFATSSEKRKGDGANKGDVGDDDDAYDDDEKKRKKKKKKMSRFEESDDSDSD